jgi:hypothetical protein
MTALGMVAGSNPHRMLPRLFRSFKRRSVPERKAFALATVLVVAVRIALTIAPSRWIIGAVRRLSQRTPSRVVRRRGTVMSDSTLVWAVETASRFVPRATCLTQALAAQIVLQRHGYSATFCLGVPAIPVRPFRAHAWLELDGRIILGGEESRRLARLSSLMPVEFQPSVEQFGRGIDRAAGMRH